jgi:hypothetical protein
MKLTLLSAALASVLVLSGCGANDDEEAKAAISEYLVSQGGGQMMQLEEGEADCIAGDMVDGIGVDQLKEYGLLNDDGTVNEEAQTNEMSQEDSEVMVDSVFDCTDVMGTMRDQLSGAMGEQSPEVKACLEEALTEDLVRESLIANFSGDAQAAQEKLTAPLAECLAGGPATN